MEWREAHNQGHTVDSESVVLENSSIGETASPLFWILCRSCGLNHLLELHQLVVTLLGCFVGSVFLAPHGWFVSRFCLSQVPRDATESDDSTLISEHCLSPLVPLWIAKCPAEKWLQVIFLPTSHECPPNTPILFHVVGTPSAYLHRRKVAQGSWFLYVLGWWGPICKEFNNNPISFVAMCISHAPLLISAVFLQIGILTWPFPSSALHIWEAVILQATLPCPPYGWYIQASGFLLLMLCQRSSIHWVQNSVHVCCLWVSGQPSSCQVWSILKGVPWG